MADAPLACSGDSTRDGVESSRAVAATAEKLRNLADWLDAHPSAVVHHVSFIDAFHNGLVIVTSYAADSVDEIAEAARGLGGRWTFTASDTAFKSSQQILPGVLFEFYVSRAKAETIADAA